MNEKLLNLRMVWIAVVILLVILLATTIAVPMGRVKYVQDFQHNNYHRIGKLKPLERTLPATETGQPILGGPIYFAVNQPRLFKKAEVKIRFRTNPNFNHSQIELGILQDKARWQYELQPLENSLIEETSRKWAGVLANDEVLLQKASKYRSIDEFKKNPPAFEKIATYNNDWQLAKNFTPPAPGRTTIDWSLRGGYAFYALAASGTLDIKFDFAANQEASEHVPQTEILLYQGRNLIVSKKLGAERKLGDQAGRWSYDFAGENLAAGYYKAIVRADDNLVTNKITVNQSNVSFVGGLKFTDRQKTPLEFWTNSREINLLAVDSRSVGDVYLNDTRQLIFEAYKQYSYKNKDRNTKMKLTKPGLEISGDGVFATTEAGLFDPRLKRIDSLTDLEKEGIEYILARYKESSKTGGWHEATANFDLTGTDLDKGSYSFVLSIPGFKSDDELLDWLEIGNIQVVLTGDNLWQTIKIYTKKAIRKLLF